MLNIILIILIVLLTICNKSVKKIEKFDGGQGMFVNIDSKKLYNNRKLREEWKNEYPFPNNKLKYKNCDEYRDYKLFNQPEDTYHNAKVEFGDYIENDKKVKKSFEIPCNKFNKKKNLSDYIKQDRKKNLVLNKIDYRDAEDYYKDNYGYNIQPLNTEEWFLPSNYTLFSKYNRPTLDKKIVDKEIPPKDKYRVRALNWHFGVKE